MDFNNNRSISKTPISLISNNNNNYNNKSDQIIKIILEENQILKKTIAQKYPNEATFSSLLDLLEIQRSKIDNLEQGIIYINKRNNQKTCI